MLSQFLLVLLSPRLLRLLHRRRLFLSPLFVVALLVLSGAVALVELLRSLFSEGGLLLLGGVLVEGQLFLDELDGRVDLGHGGGGEELDGLEVSDSVDSVGEGVVFGLLLFLLGLLSLLGLFV